MSVRRRTAVVTTLAALVLASGTVGAAAQAPTPALLTEPPPVLAWAACGTTPEGTAAGVECATADLPMDYDDPAAGRVQIAVARVPADDPATRIGSLFLNFGGPGAATAEVLQALGDQLYPGLSARFDIVGFDPRGVGRSTPAVDCRVDQVTEGLWAHPFPTPLDLDPQALVARAQRYVDACLANNGAILEHASTANVARDMDALRASLGEEQLTYLGFSYGTFLGATYATLFPDRYRALVLDGALDPAAYIHDPVAVSTAQGAALERALDRFAGACAADQAACSGFGGADPLAAYDALLATADATPIPAPRFTDNPEPVTPEVILDVTQSLLYAKQLWGLLAAGLAQAAAGDGSTLRAIFDLAIYPEDPDGSDDPGPDRFVAIGASEREWPRDVDSYLRRGAQEWAAYPHFWAAGAYAEIGFALWPRTDADAFGGPFVASPSAPTALVVGTTYDMATPYAGAIQLTRQLGNARLLTMEGDGHTAYGGNSPCIDAATDAYLIDLTLPADGTVCQQEVPLTAPQPVPVEAATSAATELLLRAAR
ncbi:alpha/beta hydrolase [Geodermatophilus sp. CPCC 205506]|uniref:alpha/beta hydrolase n=1 Tax=Geodermatophilus sp. CPCC 205506 TaxID=2936596 RepID=UPI003EEFE6D6